MVRLKGPREQSLSPRPSLTDLHSPPAIPPNRPTSQLPPPPSPPSSPQLKVSVSPVASPMAFTYSNGLHSPSPKLAVDPLPGFIKRHRTLSLESSSSDASSTLPTLASFPRRVQHSPSVASSRTYATPRAHAAEVESQTGHDFDWDDGPPETAEAWAFVRASIDRQERLQQAHIHALEDHVGTLKKTIAELEAAVHRQATELSFLPLEHRRVWDEEKKKLLEESRAKNGQIQRLQRDVEEAQKALATSSCTCPRANGVSGAPTYGDLEEELRATTERLQLQRTEHETKVETWRTRADDLQARLTLAGEKSKEHEFVIASMEKDLKSRMDEVRRLKVELEEARRGGAAVQPGAGYHSAPIPADRSSTSIPAPTSSRSQPPLPPPPLSKLETLGLPVGKPPGWDSSLGFRRY